MDRPVYPVKVRLDHWLAQQYPDVSRSFLQKLCTNDEVLVNGKAEKSGFKLRPGDDVEVLHDMSAIGKIEDIDLPIIYQDKDVVVINKPAGIISHSRGKFWNEPSVASFIRQLTGQEGERPGIVHRLDRATSGVMICARNQASLSWLQRQFSLRKVQKTYAAVVEGLPVPPEAIIDMPIERNPKAPSTFKVGANGKPAQTTYKTLSSVKNRALIELKPLTGRTHQLRVHMKQLGHPIVGDTLYGGPAAERLMLHAKSLELMMPDKQRVVFEAPLPAEFNLTSSNE